MTAKQIPRVMEREMGLTLAEFRRSFASAVEPYIYTQHDREFVVAHPEGEVRISLGETTQRQIAMLAIPKTKVFFNFGDLNETSRVEFMERFDRYFHRGGG